MTALVRVLVVDDEPAFREGLQVALRAEGFDVSLAEDGEESVWLAGQNVTERLRTEEVGAGASIGTRGATGERRAECES